MRNSTVPMPVIAIYFSDPEPLGYPFNKQTYLDIYSTLIRNIESHGIDVRIVRGSGYAGTGRFTDSWKLLPDGRVEDAGTVRANLIFNRDDRNTIPRVTDCPIINHPDFDELCMDKVKTAAAFPELSPKTAAIESWNDCQDVLRDWNLKPTDHVVLKKNFETEGRGIHVLPVSDVGETLYDSWANVLAQEFIDGSVGVPGITEGLHDLRVTVVDGEPINSFLRTPPAGSLVANVTRGGTGRSIDLADVPAAVLDMVKQITAQVARYSPLLFGADFMNSADGYKLVELNSRPGVQHPSWSGTYELFNDAVVRMLVKAVK